MMMLRSSVCACDDDVVSSVCDDVALECVCVLTCFVRKLPLSRRCGRSGVAVSRFGCVQVKM